MLENLKVLELASVLAGPSVGQFFAELGADVIKIENSRMGGDVTRSWRLPTESNDDDRSAYFCSVNWGKRSLAIDLIQVNDREVLYKLVSKTDIVIASYKPGDAEKLGVSYEQLKKINPQIIYGQVTGYGADNERVGYDAIIQAESGFMDLNGEAGGGPLKMPVALIDVLAAHHLKEGLLLALLKKERTGEGSIVEVSLIQAAISSLCNQATNWLVAHSLPTRKGSLHPNIAPYGEVFDTKDQKKVILAVGSDRQFYDLCDLLAIGYLINDKRFKTNQDRVKNRVELQKILNQKISEHASDSLMNKIHVHKIPAGIVQNLKEVFEMRESKSIMLEKGGFTGVRNFVGQINKSGSADLLPPPHFGEHTQKVIESVNLL